MGSTSHPEAAKEGIGLLGYPHQRPCVHCGANAVLLVSVYNEADYECRGTPVESWSAYGPDRCGRVFTITRADEEAHEQIRQPGALYGEGA